MALIFPTLIGINGNRKIRNRTDRLNHLLIIVAPQLHFQYIELSGTFFCLFTHYIGCVNANGKCGRRCFLPVQSPYFIPRSLQQFTHQIMQSDIHRCFCRRIPYRERVYITQNIFQPERIGKLSDNILHLFQKSQHTVHCAQLMLQVRRHGGFSITDDSVILYFNLHIRSSGARIGSHRKDMAQFQLIRKETQLHSGHNAAFIDAEQCRRYPFTCQYAIDSHARA